MSSERSYLFSGTVYSINPGRTVLKKIIFPDELKAFGNDFECEVMGSYEIARLNLNLENEIKIKAKISGFDLKTKIMKLHKVECAKKIVNQAYEMKPPKKYNQDYTNNALVDTPDFSVEKILGKEHPYLEKISKNLNNEYPYRKNFLKGMNIVAEVNRLPSLYAFNALKSTRVGATTNTSIGSLVQGKKIVVVVPNNDVMAAVENAYTEYVRLTGDNTKTFRKIQSNVKVCQNAQAKIEKNVTAEELSFLMRGNCKKCGVGSVVDEKIAGVIKTDKVLDQRLFGKESEIEKIQLHPILPEGDKNHCQQKAIVDELFCLQKEGFKLAYDLTVITYDKAFALMKSQEQNEGIIAPMLMKVIRNADVLLFDEFGQYLSKQPHEVKVWERMEMLDTTSKKKKKKNPTPITTDIYEKLDEIEEAMDSLEKFKYQTIKPIFNEFLRKVKEIIEEKRTFRRIRNPLISAPYTGEQQYQGTTMAEKLETFFWDNYSQFENEINPENKNEIKYLISLMMVLLSEDIVFHFSENKTWIKNEKTKDYEKFKIETLKLLPADDVLVQNINQLIGRNQKVIFTDATTPPFRFNSLDRTVRNIMFGDPLETNKKLLVIQDTDLWKFDITRWHKGGETSKTGYKAKVINALFQTIKKVGAENIKIWAPNKDIAKEFVVLLNLKIENLTCTPDRTNYPDRVIVDWMRSAGALGVESDRRIHVIVGNPDVPKSAYEYLAFMYSDYFDAIPEQVLAEVGREYNVSLDKIREIIGTFHTPEFIGSVSYRKETPDAIEAELISIISDQLRGFFVGAAGWQAGSRAKDPSAKIPSVLYLLGWNELPMLNMIQWGYDLQILGGRKTATDMATIISPPIATQGGVEDAVDWQAGEERDPTLLLSKNFSELPRAISYFLAFKGESITSKYIWPNISPNLQVGYDSENHRNGFFVALNRCLKSDSIRVTETSPGEFTYNFGYSAGINISDPDMKLVFKVLHSAYRNKKEEVLVGDITRNNRSKKKTKSKKGKKNANKIETEKVKEAFKLIKKHKLLEGSSWKVEQYEVKRGKDMGKHLKIVKNKTAIG